MKKIATTRGAAFITVLPILFVLEPRIFDWPVALKALIVSGIMVLTMTYITMPLITWLKKLLGLSVK